MMTPAPPRTTLDGIAYENAETIGMRYRSRVAAGQPPASAYADLIAPVTTPGVTHGPAGDFAHLCSHRPDALADAQGLGCPRWPACVELDAPTLDLHERAQRALAGASRAAAHAAAVHYAALADLRPRGYAGRHRREARSARTIRSTTTIGESL